MYYSTNGRTYKQWNFDVFETIQIMQNLFVLAIIVDNIDLSSSWTHYVLIFFQ